MCTMSFPKTALVFKLTFLQNIEASACKHIFQRLLICLAVCWQFDNYLSLTDCLKPLLNSLCITSVKISEFALIIFVGRSDSWQTLALSRFKISLFISDFVISWNENGLPMFWLLINTYNTGMVFVLLNYPLNRVPNCQ